VPPLFRYIDVGGEMIAQQLFSSLSLEITRRCNLKCAHCMRGDAQAAVMDPAMFDDFVVRHNLRFFRILWINGGEPCLVPEAIRGILNVVKRRNIWVDRFGIGTNGTKMDVLDELVREVRGMPEYIKYSEFCISEDEFHKKGLKDSKVVEGLKSLLGSRIIVRDRNIVLPLGRAREWTEGLTHRIEIARVGVDWLSGFVDNVAQFFSLSCEGKVVCGLDLSYDMHEGGFVFLEAGQEVKDVDKEKVFNVLRFANV